VPGAGTVARVIPLVRLLAAGVLAVALVSGCGGDDDGDAPAGPPMTASTQGEPARPSAPADAPEEPEKPEELRRKRTPDSLAGCIREAPGVSEVLLKAGDSEDARFFGDLVGGRVDVIGVTAEDEAAELTLALFASAADAKRAAPGAGGGGGLSSRAEGSAVIVAPARADTAAIEDCLRASGYSGAG
jgi:hypothetical protein